MIHLKNVSKSFVDVEGSSLSVLHNINLSITTPSATAIIGPSGSGKSTLLSLIAGLEKPTTGEVTVLGHKLNELSERDLALFRSKNLGFVFQSFHLLPHYSAIENVIVAADIAGIPNSRERASEALERVGLGVRRKHLPSQLSGGEQQRVAVARAFVTRPKIILCDEPTGSLDQENAAKILKILLDIQVDVGALILLVTHDKEVAAQAKNSVRVQFGNVITEGGHG